MSLESEEKVNESDTEIQSVDQKIEKLNQQPIDLGGIFNVKISNFKSDDKFEKEISECKEMFLSDPRTQHKYPCTLDFLGSPVLSDFDYMITNPDLPLQLWIKDKLTLRFYMKLSKLDKRILCILACKLNDFELFKILTEDDILYEYLLKCSIAYDRSNFLEFYLTTQDKIDKIISSDLNDIIDHNAVESLKFMLSIFKGERDIWLQDMFGLAIAANKLDIIMILINYGIDINYAPYIKDAVMRIRYESTKILLEHKVNTKDLNLLSKAMEHPYDDIIELLIDHNIDVKIYYSISSPLNKAIEKGKIKIVKKLVELGCPIANGNLHAIEDSLSYNKFEIFKYLLDYQNLDWYSIHRMMKIVENHSEIYEYLKKSK